MAMGFISANRAQNPDLVQAVMQQAQLNNAEKARKQNQNKQMIDAGLQIADAVPAAGAGAGASTVTPTLVGAGGELASMAPVAADALMGTAAGTMAAPAGAGLGTAAGAGLGTAAGAGLGTAAAGAGAGAAGVGAGTLAGTTAAGASMGPVGWLALAGLAYGLMKKKD